MDENLEADIPADSLPNTPQNPSNEPVPQESGTPTTDSKTPAAAEPANAANETTASVGDFTFRYAKSFGTGLNGKEGDTVSLKIGIPAKKEKVNTTLYPRSVQFDIKLNIAEGEINKLKVPVRLTVPVPLGFNINRLVVLHYNEDGTYEKIIPRRNSDETVSFAVTHFSTFVFAEEAEGVSPKTGEETDWMIFCLLAGAFILLLQSGNVVKRVRE
ncbi:MAG: hypothetical protein K6G30_05520 [Acetatifactor sp.]|nr:hypothetical protein [Acetatifactor sp.]